MKIVLTGSLGNIGKPLTRLLVEHGHNVTVISSKEERVSEIKNLGAVAAIGGIQDLDFLTETFKGADAVYLMEAWEGIGSLFDNKIDFLAGFKKIAQNYVTAVRQSGIKKIIHLSSVGAHSGQGNGSLLVHYHVEQILQTLAEDVSIKFMRPVGFFSNLYRSFLTIQSQGKIIQSYGGERKEPWVSPYDIAATIADEMEKSFNGRTVHYIASDEVSPNEIAAVLGQSIGNPYLEWKVIPAAELLGQMLSAGINEWIAKGMVAMQMAQGDGSLYEDFYANKPTFGKVKLADFAREFAQIYTKKIN